jgi:glutamyl-tRNA synthetase
MGYPAAALRNYLARLGWSHGDDEFFTDDQAREWFDLSGINRAPARLDLKKLDHLTGLHFSAMDDAAVLHELEGYLAATGDGVLDETQRAGLMKAMPALKDRARSCGQIIERALYPDVAADRAGPEGGGGA